MYSEWHGHRIVTDDCPKCVEKCELEYGLGQFTCCELCDSLCMFVNEIMKLDDEEFPPKTVKGLIYNIQMHLHSEGFAWHLFDPVSFHDLHNCVDNIMKEDHSKGLGVTKKAKIISLGMKELLWTKHILEDTPFQLRFTVLYLLGSPWYSLCLEGWERAI